MVLSCWWVVCRFWLLRVCVCVCVLVVLGWVCVI